MTVGMRSLFAIALPAALIALVVAPATAAAARPCLPGQTAPVCQTWSAKVVSVGDGDTIDVDIVGDGTGRAHHVRITGIQAMELRRYSSAASQRRGDCHSREATRRMEQLVLNRRARLLAQHASSTTAKRRRLRRALLVRKGGRWVDPAAVLLREGHALWLPNGREWAWNGRYRRLSLGAASRHRRLFTRSYCGAGPGAADSIRMSLRWDAHGVDGTNVAGEYARVTNVGRRRVRMGGWHFRDSALRRYTLPGRTVLAPGATLTIHVGRGTRRPGHLFWGLGIPIFENPSRDRRATGDGAYLFDGQGDLRAWVIYPCDGCSQPGSREQDRDQDGGAKKPTKPGKGGPPWRD